MKQIILRYGLMSGVLAAILMVATVRLEDFENGAWYGYSGMLLSMLFVFFGVKTYRDQVAGGELSFGKGFQVGLGIALISCVCYVLAWMVVYETIMPDFLEKYSAHVLSKMSASGASEAAIEQKRLEMLEFGEMYKNPFLRFAFTFLEPFPVGLAVSLISAIVLKKRR